MNSIEEHLEAIRTLRVVIATHEHAILERTITIQRILMAEALAGRAPDSTDDPTIVKMFEQFIAEQTDNVWDCIQFREWALPIWPHLKQKIRQGAHPALCRCVDHGLCVRVPGGFKKVVAA